MTLLLVGLLSRMHPAIALSIPERYLKISTSVPSDTATYEFGMTYSNPGAIGSVEFELCQNDPFVATACTVPSGLDLSTASLTAQTGETGFSIHPSSTANKIILTRPSAPVTPQPSSYTFTPVTNPDAVGTYYVRLRTFASTDASGPDTEKGGMAFSMRSNLSVSTEVPPYLEFCTGTTIAGLSCSGASGFGSDFGELSKVATGTATSQFLVATNAGFGMNVRVYGTTMTSGNDEIPALSGAAAVPGISQFGLNLRANTLPAVGEEPAGSGTVSVAPGYNTPNQFRFASSDVVAQSSGTTNFQKFTTSYVVNVSTAQPPGHYAATMTYVCLANF
jgi:hypothetical protein